MDGVAITGAQSERRRTGRTRVVAVVAGLAAIALAVTLAVAIAEPDDRVRPASRSGDASGPMGGALIDTPGTSDERVEVGGIAVDGARIEMGRVPLMKTVNPTWVLRNTTGGAVTLGEPKATVVAGCCPGPLHLDMRVVPPGRHATLSFPLQMHPGMDGPHDFQLTVPVGPEGDALVLGVTGDFR